MSTMNTDSFADVKQIISLVNDQDLRSNLLKANVENLRTKTCQMESEIKNINAKIKLFSDSHNDMSDSCSDADHEHKGCHNDLDYIEAQMLVLIGIQTSVNKAASDINDLKVLLQQIKDMNNGLDSTTTGIEAYLSKITLAYNQINLQIQNDIKPKVSDFSTKLSKINGYLSGPESDKLKSVQDKITAFMLRFDSDYTKLQGLEQEILDLNSYIRQFPSPSSLQNSKVNLNSLAKTIHLLGTEVLTLLALVPGSKLDQPDVHRLKYLLNSKIKIVDS